MEVAAAQKFFSGYIILSCGGENILSIGIGGCVRKNVLSVRGDEMAGCVDCPSVTG
jgi:hypothetical protein